MALIWRDGPRANCTVVVLAARGPVFQNGRGRLRAMLLTFRTGEAGWVRLEEHASGEALEVHLPAHRKQQLSTDITLEVRHAGE